MSTRGLVERLNKLADYYDLVSGFEFRAEIIREAAARIEGLERIRDAAQRVLVGLNARIDEAPRNAVPVFDGIAELSSALASFALSNTGGGGD